MHISRISPDDKTAPNVLAAQANLSAMLTAIRAELSTVISAPVGFGGAEAKRRRRDELILQGLAADLRARLVEARAAR